MYADWSTPGAASAAVGVVRLGMEFRVYCFTTAKQQFCTSVEDGPETYMRHSKASTVAHEQVCRRYTHGINGIATG